VILYFILTKQFSFIEELRPAFEDVILEVLGRLFMERREFYEKLLADPCLDILVQAIAPYVFQAGGAEFGIARNLLSVLMRHHSFVGSLFTSNPGMLISLLEDSQGNHIDRICDFFRAHPDILTPDVIFVPESVFGGIYRQSSLKFVQLFTGDRQGRVIGQILRHSTAGDLGFPGNDFFGFVAKTPFLQTVVPEALRELVALVPGSSAWLSVFSTFPAYFFVGVEALHADFEYVLKLVGHFKFDEVSVDELQDVLRFCIAHEQVFAGFALSVQFRCFGAIMTALRTRKDAGFLRLCLQFLLRFERMEICGMFDEDMRDRVFERLLLPLDALSPGSGRDIDRFVAAISAPQKKISLPRTREQRKAPDLDPRTIRAWIVTISEHFDFAGMGVELKVRIAVMLQLAIVNSDIGDDPEMLQASGQLLMTIKETVVFPIQPQFLVTLIRRTEEFQLRASERDRELGFLYMELLRVAREMQGSMLECVSAIVNES
jgi:hypothetical protein